jgi:hypothetical protein
VRLPVTKPEDGSDPHLRNSSYSGRLLGTVRSPCDKGVGGSTRWSCVGHVRVEPTEQGAEGAVRNEHRSVDSLLQRFRLGSLPDIRQSVSEARQVGQNLSVRHSEQGLTPRLCRAELSEGYVQSCEREICKVAYAGAMPNVSCACLRC